MTDKLIVDFMYLWNKLYYVCGDNVTDKVLEIIDKIAEENHYSKVAFVLDSATSTHKRKALLEQYKGNRGDKTKVYEAVQSCIQQAKEKYPKFCFLTSTDYEADDIIVSLCQLSRHCNISVYSGDNDLYQLLPLDYVSISDKYTGGMRLKPVNRDDIIKKYMKKYGIVEFNITDVVKWKTFKGDSSDNIPVAVPRLPNYLIQALITEYWDGTAPLTSSILYKMSLYLWKCDKKWWAKFHENRDNIIRNYKLVQLTHKDPSKVLSCVKGI